MNILQHIFPYLKYYFTSSTKYDVHSPFLFEFVTKVLEDNSEYEAYNILEKLCDELRNNKKVISIEDFGAGSQYSDSRQKSILEIFSNTAYKGKYGKLLFRIVQFYKPQRIIELGTGLGIATAYMALANKQTAITTIEGSSAIADEAERHFRKIGINNIHIIKGTFNDVLPQLLEKESKTDLFLIDGNHRYESTLQYFNWILPHCHNDTIVVFDDIRWSRGMLKAWKEITANEALTLSLDLYKTGIVFFRKEIKVKQHFAIRF